MKHFIRLAAMILALTLIVPFAADIVPAGTGAHVAVYAAEKMLNYTELNIAVGQKVRLTANTSAKVTWSMSNKKIAKVSSKGLVTGIKLGKSKIYANVNGKKYTCVVNVIKPEFTMKGYNDGYYVLGKGKSVKFSLGVTTGVKWWSTNPYVVTVSSNGTVKAIRDGSGMIIGEVAGKKYCCTVSTVSLDTIYGAGAYYTITLFDPENGVSYEISDSACAYRLMAWDDFILLDPDSGENTQALIAISELEKAEYGMPGYFNCVWLTNSSLKDKNHVFQKGDKLGNFKITSAYTSVEYTPNKGEYNYENYNIGLTGIGVSGKVQFTTALSYEDIGPDARGYHIDYEKTMAMIEKYNLPSICNTTSMEFLFTPEQEAYVDKYYKQTGGKTKFTITISDYSQMYLYYDGKFGFMYATVSDVKYAG